MQLKKYQKRVLDNICDYTEKYVELGSPKAAYDAHLEEDGLAPGRNGVEPYHDKLVGVPNVCVKVPTGGGKTFIAANAIGLIADILPQTPADVVVWLVPRREILNQTLRQLKDPDNFLRMALDRDFSHRVEVLDKEEGLRGHGFSRNTVEDQLTLFVLSYDSFKNKDGRRAYAENSALVNLTDYQKQTNQAVDVDGADDTALISALAGTNPIVVVDESHHASSRLSLDMLKNLNPRFVLELTATPRPDSNVICRVKASELKSEEMVKIPVIVYRRGGRNSVVGDAIMLQRRLEEAARLAEQKGGRYIRPIVLFQAERRGQEDETGTYQKLKQALLDIGIPEDQIAIRTGDVDELGGCNLMDPGCPIRFIITVEALAEGWDCPFAYVLATVANKNSKISVEQIVGRILRQPYAKRSPEPCLNISYVLTSSSDFKRTIDEVVAGLNGAGFSAKDLVTNEKAPAPKPSSDEQSAIELNFQKSASETPLDENEFCLHPVDSASSTVSNSNHSSEPSNTAAASVDDMISDAEESERKMADDSSKDAANTPGTSTGIGEGSNIFGFRHDIASQVEELRLPQFRTKQSAGLFSLGETQPFDAALLISRLDLNKCAADVHLSAATIDDVRQIDVAEDSDEFKARHLDRADTEYLRSLFATKSTGSKREFVRTGIINLMSSRFKNTYSAAGLSDYVRRVVDSLADAEIDAYVDNASRYAEAVTSAIRREAQAWVREQFYKELETGRIVLEPCYRLPMQIVPKKATTLYDRTLYKAEDGSMNGLEDKMADLLANTPQILWWHRVMESKPGEFYINGFINHYPDFIAQTDSGTVLAIETKGEHLKNDDSAAKLELGRAWASRSSGMEGDQYRYFMVFARDPLDAEGSYGFDEFRELLQDLS